MIWFPLVCVISGHTYRPGLGDSIAEGNSSLVPPDADIDRWMRVGVHPTARPLSGCLNRVVPGPNSRMALTASIYRLYTSRENYYGLGALKLAARFKDTIGGHDSAPWIDLILLVNEPDKDISSTLKARPTLHCYWPNAPPPCALFKAAPVWSYQGIQ